MAEVVKVPLIGGVKKPWLYAGGAAVAGIAGYAWWTRGAIVEEEGFDVELPADEFEPPTVVDSGISVGGGASVGEPIARTNVEWRQMAAEQAAALGFSDAVINSGLTKYLAKQRLTATEATMMAAIVAILGQPPSGGPYSILQESPAPPPPPPGGGHQPPPGHTPPPPAPKLVGIGFQRLVKTGRSTFDVNFVPTAGATAFRYRRISGGKGSTYATVSAASAMITSGTYKGTAKIRGRALFARPTRFSVGIAARNSAGQWGPEARTNEIVLP